MCRISACIQQYIYYHGLAHEGLTMKTLDRITHMVDRTFCGRALSEINCPETGSECRVYAFM
jgi:hypothetical protein